MNSSAVTRLPIGPRLSWDTRKSMSLHLRSAMRQSNPAMATMRTSMRTACTTQVQKTGRQHEKPRREACTLPSCSLETANRRLPNLRWRSIGYINYSKQSPGRVLRTPTMNGHQKVPSITVMQLPLYLNSLNKPITIRLQSSKVEKMSFDALFAFLRNMNRQLTERSRLHICQCGVL